MDCNRERKIEIGNVPDFWERVCASGTRFLGLDYDGTLAPFHVDPMQARPLSGVLELLRAIVAKDKMSVAVVSGRPVAEVLELLENLPVTIIGSHGFELRRPDDDTCIVRSPSAEQKEGLQKAKTKALQRGYGRKLEFKIASIAMHTRGVDARLASTMEESMFTEWSRLALLYDLECRRFNGGVEIRCAGWHKGDAVSELLFHQPPGVFPVYVGDDETDEDAFRIIQERGIGIKVGTSSYPTAAKGFLKDCQAVKQFLEAWISLTCTCGS
ncbi:trehalose-phosphatase [Desulforhabdus amnigena]|jgi:trehalose-phosphatase|uniref:Trehalose 6-phosphate phosphatase n=1 Tax=Desulforhabdus amnigena TaxID=40218 RepID=A0A9W6D350_9BACT|nr:trehalose-phosphatase [Desulforhabdus amnigena]NLJ29325.1 trehalose-phosphatase [Deltaproteobacteria bacterium]GLI34408.1 trehalose 6-phosphate phosphatase [Desulforhabdus amnigena]